MIEPSTANTTRSTTWCTDSTRPTLTTDPGSYDVFNGALIKFDDAFNVELYALVNAGDTIPSTDLATDLFGRYEPTAFDQLETPPRRAITTFLQTAVATCSDSSDIQSL